MTNEEKPGFRHKLKRFLYGMTGYEIARLSLRQRGHMEQLFILVTMGNLLGIPILPSYYSLSLVPYMTPQIDIWKRRMLRERDLVDAFV
ncbi:MAG: hypothetical protein Fur0043_22680 [Anaerolineales bacterium]